MRYCEMCGVSGMNIEVREIWHDGEYLRDVLRQV